jgi:hypothetical protein
MGVFVPIMLIALFAALGSSPLTHAGRELKVGSAESVVQESELEHREPFAPAELLEINDERDVI